MLTDEIGEVVLELTDIGAIASFRPRSIVSSEVWDVDLGALAQAFGKRVQVFSMGA